MNDPTSHDPNNGDVLNHDPAGGPVGTGGPADRGRGEAGTSSEPRRQTRWLYARVLVVQFVTLVALYWLQATFGAG